MEHGRCNDRVIRSTIPNTEPFFLKTIKNPKSAEFQAEDLSQLAGYASEAACPSEKKQRRQWLLQMMKDQYSLIGSQSMSPCLPRKAARETSQSVCQHQMFLPPKLKTQQEHTWGSQHWDFKIYERQGKRMEKVMHCSERFLNTHSGSVFFQDVKMCNLYTQCIKISDVMMHQ